MNGRTPTHTLIILEKNVHILWAIGNPRITVSLDKVFASTMGSSQMWGVACSSDWKQNIGILVQYIYYHISFEQGCDFSVDQISVFHAEYYLFEHV